ncbi:MAG: NAD(P)-dependent oxidoreductase, partial [Cytophagaceae bacterium]
EEIYEQADMLSLHIPLNDETRGMVNEEYLGKFRKKIWLINTARGEVVPLAALNSALRSGKVIGAALDVLENEKLQKLSEQERENFKEIIASDKVLFTPHVAGWTYESYVRINEILADKIKAAIGFQGFGG